MNENLTLAERRALQLEKDREAEIRREEAEEQRRYDLAQKIISTIEKPEVRAKVEDMLVQDGGVWVTGLGCLCEDGFCSWQVGFRKYMKEYEDKWAEQGVALMYSIPGVKLYFKGQPIKRSLELNPETLETKYGRFY